MIWLLAFALPAVALLAFIAADAARNLARLVRDAAVGWRRARDDDPFDEACALTGQDSTNDAFAAIAAELAGDFAHLDIRRLEALYLVNQETS